MKFPPQFLYRFSLFLYDKIYDFIHIFNKNATKYNQKKMETLSNLYHGASGEQLYRMYIAKNISRLIITLPIIIIIWIAVLISELSKSNSADYINRPDCGSANISKVVDITIDGSHFSVPIDIQPRLLTLEEALTAMDSLKSEMIREFLRDNPDLDNIDKPVNLVSDINESGVHIDWRILTPEYINPDGTLQYDNIPAEGTYATLIADFKISGHTISATLNPYIYPREKNPEEIIARELEDYINGDDARTSGTVNLPDTSSLGRIENITFADDETSKTYQTFLVLFLLSVTVPFLVYMLGRRKLEDADKARREQLSHDYPGIVSKLTLLTSAGLSMHHAFQKILRDYDERNKSQPRRYVYEEIQLALQKISTGCGEVTAFYEFGRNCSLSCYAKLGTLIGQNMVKGSKDFRFLLEQEVTNAFDEQKASFRIKSEQASTKLLIPMIMMMAVIFMIIICPAFIVISQ